MDEINNASLNAGEKKRKFIGRYEHKIDVKGRFIIPGAYRELLSKRLYITIGLDRCLYLFSEEEFDAASEVIAKGNNGTEKYRMFARKFFSTAFDCECDSQGRTVIPPGLRQYAGLTKDVIVAGVNNKIELWDKEEFEKADQMVNMSDYNSTFEEPIKIFL